MHIQSSASSISLLLLPSLAVAINWDCSNIRVDGKKWDLSPLGGVHSVYNVAEHPPVKRNTTYTIDLCRPLKNSECQAGTNICGVETSIYQDGHKDITGTIPIAGNYVTGSGHTLDPKVKRLKSKDSEVEGLRIKLHGGQYPFDSKNGRKQKAVIQMICDPNRTGLEGEPKNDKDGKKEQRDEATAAGSHGVEAKEEKADDKTPEQDKPNNGTSLYFVSYEPDDETDVLRLDWYTKYACEDYRDDNGGPAKNKPAWGAFTWIIIVVFLGVSAYLIFGSWLNYNRYGARGWDLLPHGDTLRDIPYIVKDWGRAIASTVQGSGNRGGYSAV